jgi:hypothetical protein
MSKREKIILMLALAAMVYGLVNFFIFPKKDNSLKTQGLITEPDKITANFAMDSMSKISKIETLRKQAQLQNLISKIESPWGNDPFVLSLEPATLADVSSLTSPLSRFIYSGYMSVGKISFAVINGVEYKIGETINEYEYKVIKITPKKVVLQKDTEQGAGCYIFKRRIRILWKYNFHKWT